VLGLADIGWGGNDEADAVAQFLQARDTPVARVFQYLSFEPTRPHSDQRLGFECRVSEEDAARWVRANRPE
jgi:hypothetical protein